MIFALIPIAGQTNWNSSLVTYNQNDRLMYNPDSFGNRVVDFSYAGYRNNMEPIPDVPVMLEINPVPGDNTSHIQTAINTVEAMPTDADGFRGALLLTAGQYDVSGILRIDASGVVLRGVGDGSDTTSNTVIYATGNLPYQRTVLNAGGGEVALWGYNLQFPQVDIITDTVRAGDRRFQVADPGSFNVGDNIIIVHPCTEDWLTSIDYGGTHSGEGAWEPGVDLPWAVDSTPIYYNRKIIAIDGNTITIDAPVFNILIRSLSQSYIYAWDGAGMVRQVGIENLRIDIENSGGSDENHARSAIELYEIEDAWIRDCTALHFILSGFETGMATRVTIDNCQALDPVSVIEGGKRYNFNLYRYSQLILVKNSHATNGRHHYISNGVSSTSGCVFLNCTSSGAYTSSEGHRRWSQALLFDNHVELDGPRPGVNPRLLGLYNRGYYGTSHGWAAVNSVAWNCDVADGDLIVQRPPVGQNFAIGCSGANITGVRPPASFDEPEGYIEGSNTAGLEPVSLYLAQLAQRQNPLPAFDLNLIVDGSGLVTITPDPINGLYDSSTVVTITADPSLHWHFAGWSGDITSNNNPLLLEINSDLNIMADFDSITTRFALDLQINGSGFISATPEPNNGLYDSSAVIELLAEPAPHWLFSGWTGDLDSDINPISFQLDSAMQVGADFDSITAQYTLEVVIEGNGEVIIDPEPYSGTYDTGQFVHLTAQPDFGWEFIQWSGDLTGFSPEDSVLMNGNKIITANFSAIPIGAMTIDTSWSMAYAINYVNTHDLVDTLILASAGEYVFSDIVPIRILMPLTIMAADGLSEKPVIRYSGSDPTLEDLIRVFAPLKIDGVKLDGGASTALGIFNAIHLVNEDNFTVPTGIDLTINNCELANFYRNNNSNQRGFGIRFDSEIQIGTIRIENSIFTDIGATAISIAETQNWETFSAVDSLIVRNNTFNSIGGDCIDYWSDDLPFSADAPVLIEHLTIYNSAPRSIFLVNSNGAVVRDIIVANTRLTDFSIDTNLMEISGSGIQVSHIDTFSVDPVPIVVTGGNLNTQTIYGYDPLFMNPTAGDFTLMEGSMVYGLAHDGYALGDIRWATNPPLKVDSKLSQLPDDYLLKQNYPNPFNGRTSIEFAVPAIGRVSLEIFSVTGKQVGTIVYQALEPGFYRYSLAAEDLASGVYICRFQAGDYQRIIKMTLLK